MLEKRSDIKLSIIITMVIVQKSKFCFLNSQNIVINYLNRIVISKKVLLNICSYTYTLYYNVY